MEVFAFGVVVASVWLGWQVVREVGAQRLPVEMAIRISPNSPAVLQRAAEAELVAERYDNAEVLAATSLAKAPFSVRALRVFGLAEAKTGDMERADQILTLAGNWSLRDDPTHAWLVERRLRRGDYRSSFAHADTLARRREDSLPQVFRLYRVAATEDPRSLPALAAVLANNPPWRTAFLDSLYDTAEGHGVAANLAVLLQQTPKPFTTAELSQLYTGLAVFRMVPAIREVRRRIRRPDPTRPLVNGDFSNPEDPAPLGWSIATAPGLAAEIIEDDVRPQEKALRVEINRFAIRPVAEQLLLLDGGSYRFSGESRQEGQTAVERMAWTISCLESGRELARSGLNTGADGWAGFGSDLVVPAVGCTAQWLRLSPLPDPAPGRQVVWLDRLRVSPAP